MRGEYRAFVAAGKLVAEDAAAAAFTSASSSSTGAATASPPARGPLAPRPSGLSSLFDPSVPRLGDLCEPSGEALVSRKLSSTSSMLLAIPRRRRARGDTGQGEEQAERQGGGGVDALASGASSPRWTSA